MKGERWRLVSPHLDQVLELSGEARQRYLTDLAGEDPALAADVELLLGEERALRDEQYLEHDPQDLLAESHLVGQIFGAYALVEPLALALFALAAVRHSARTATSWIPASAPAEDPGRSGWRRHLRSGTSTNRHVEA